MAEMASPRGTSESWNLKIKKDPAIRQSRKVGLGAGSECAKTPRWRQPERTDESRMAGAPRTGWWEEIPCCIAVFSTCIFFILPHYGEKLMKELLMNLLLGGRNLSYYKGLWPLDNQSSSSIWVSYLLKKKSVFGYT